ncbi:hypothetical protein [Maribacter cobaltidurans]|uniref:Uncharacterized protein n=1 Tax=Maribacter cobaltidurans TaxID=1178778 RepID=A0A223V546_9FLAO|nr:hypothetical protein [Maribacter cobaltidurans]ASV30260.1 hypothetical protein CJ263_08530 [Maribacter cobaltidurans]GGD77098.1 hypothetical protein GCM10011412_13590 [Maribacter cobaltidurans]
MSLFPLEVGNLDGLFVLILLIMFGPAALLGIIGIILMTKNKKKAGKIFMILAGVYLLISLGVCGSMIVGL